MQCGKTLTLLRKFRNTTQHQLAKKLNVKQQYISQLEKQSHINESILKKILHALNSNKSEWEQFRKLPPPETEG